MKRLLKRLSAIGLAIVIVSGIVPGITYLHDTAWTGKVKAAEIVSGGICEDGLSWEIDDNGILLISGTGQMQDYTSRVRKKETTTPWWPEYESVSSAPWSDYKFDKVIIDNGITGIGNNAFMRCYGLSEITMPEGITRIGEFAFEDCNKLKEMTIPSSVTTIDDGAFLFCTGLMNVELPNELVYLGERAFDSCSNLSSMVLPDSLTIISDNSFYGCNNLENVLFPDSITTIGNYAFFGCRINNLVLPNNVTIIGDYAFAENDTMNLVLPDSVTSIGDYAFYWNIDMANVLIPENVTTIGKYAFCHSYIKELVLPDSVTSIGEGAFSLCGIESVTLPNSLTSIENKVFEHNEFSSIVLPEGISSIGGWAFFDCDSLDNIIIPKSLLTINDRAFLNCSKLKTVNYTGEKSAWENIAIGDGNEPLISANIQYAPCTNHNYDNWITVKDATYTDLGLKERICKDCGYKETAEIPMLTRTSISKATVTGMVNKINTGFALTQALTVKVGNATLKEGADYTVSYANNIKVGVATAMITGVGDYTGTITKDYRIQFKDVIDKGLFYYDPIYWAVDNNIVAGWSDGTFRPMNEANRAAVVTFLWRMKGKPEPKGKTKFTDMTGNPEFDKAITWASEQGIVEGWADGTFKPWRTCNRAAIVTFLWRYAGKPNVSSKAGFKDMTGNTDFDKAISWAASKGITTGWKEDNTFRPWDTCKRLAIVSFLNRYGK